MEPAMWQPALRKSSKPIYEQLIDAMEGDVASGALPPGAQLPPQRDLAYRLKVGVGTVTKAYAEARRRGLLTATVGRGSFIAGAPGDIRVAGRDPTIDFSRNISPATAAAARLGDAFLALRRRADFADHLSYAPPTGHTAHRRAGANWLARSAGFTGADWQRLVVCEGGQHALALAFSSLCRPGDTVMTEAATFFGMKALAEQLGFGLVGLAMDEQGLLPDALDRAAAAGSKILYTIPTLQNPTGRMMGAKRRADIAKIARDRHLTIVEDDAYGHFAQGDASPPAIATLAPERTFYIATLSKTLAPGLRCGYLVAPDDDRFERVVRTVRALSYAPASFGALIGTQWIEDGTADDIATSVKAEIVARTKLARQILGKVIEGPYVAAAPHVWLPMSELKAERVAGRALRSGVAVTPPSAPIVKAGEVAGLRLCVGAPPDMAALERGLRVIESALSDAPAESGRDVV
ncbi:MAG: PLP-dependent aminotransferase family protein [Alphaproteobacteria bacterium]|nr:PLP-dependent aminotransferase family protein [Alphaproteobacteria bacterium]